MQKAILVVDVPESASAAEAEQILNAPCKDGYYLATLSLGWPGVGARAFFKLRMRARDE